MSPERPTRDRVLDAFEKMIVTGGSRSATLDAVAAEAGVSKGGLLYHFHTKDDLVRGMLDRLATQVAADAAAMAVAPQGPVDYYLETSVDSGSDLDRALIATAHLAQEHDDAARVALAGAREAWFSVLRDHLGDEPLARTIQLVGDGLYFNDSTALSDPTALGHVRDVLARLGL